MLNVTKEISRLKKVIEVPPCKHSSIFCTNGRCRLDEDAENNYECVECQQTICLEDVSYCADECQSHNCPYFKEKYGQYDHLFADPSEDEASPIVKWPKME